MSDYAGTTVPDFDRLYRQYRKLLLGIATTKFHIQFEDAEALVHDVFMSAIARWRTIRDIRRWFVGAICNACRHRLRQMGRCVSIEDEMPEHGEEPPYIDTLSAQSVLARVGPRDRRVIQLRFEQGMSAREMGRTLGCTPRAADRRLRRALARAAVQWNGRDTLRVHEHRP